MKRLFIALTLIMPIELAIAHEGATGVVKQRMDAMKQIGQSTKVLGQMIRGQASFDISVAKDAVKAIDRHAVRSKALFPKGSDKHPSEATQEIWTKPDEFAAIFQELETAAQTLFNQLDNANDPNDIKIEFGAIAKTCKSCHSTFRQKN